MKITSETDISPSRPAPDTSVWSTYCKQKTIVNSEGLQILVIVSNCPSWKNEKNSSIKTICIVTEY